MSSFAPQGMPQFIAEIGGSTLRFGWFYGVNRLLERSAGDRGNRVPYRPQRPVPTRQQLLADLARLLLADAAAVRAGTLPASTDGSVRLSRHIDRVRAMFRDLPDAVARRGARETHTARTEPLAAGLPDYFTQDFHYQTGGYLSADSARLYDVQVETLFYGAANAMRRAALLPIAELMDGRDQRRVAILDVACGTGRLLRQLRLMYPALQLTGLDLSEPYLAEAAAHMQPLRPARLIAGNAEHIPLADATEDAVTTVFLFHELPPDVRRTVAREMARVLKPGGLLVFVDSLQMGDKPGWDGLLEAFPVRFHEPYFRHYAEDDLVHLFADAGLEHRATSLAFLAKVMTFRRAS